MPSPTTTTLCWSRFFDLGSKGPCLAHELVFSDEGRRFFCSHSAASAAADVGTGEGTSAEVQSSLVGWSSDPKQQQQQQPSSPPRVLSTSRAPVLRRQQQKKTDRARRSTSTTKTAEHQGVLSASDRVAKLLLEGFYYKNIVVDCTGIAA